MYIYPAAYKVAQGTMFENLVNALYMMLSKNKISETQGTWLSEQAIVEAYVLLMSGDLKQNYCF